MAIFKNKNGETGNGGIGNIGERGNIGEWMNGGISGNGEGNIGEWRKGEYWEM
jgi:hypothetical protein